MQEALSILQALTLEIVLPGVAASAATLLLFALLSLWLKFPKLIQVWFAPLAVAAGMVAGNFYRQDAPYWSLDHDWYSLLPAAFTALFFAAVGESFREANRNGMSIVSHAIGALVTAYWLTPTDAPGSRWLWVGILFVTFRANYHVLSGPWNDALGRGSVFLAGLLWGGASAVTLLAFVHAMRYFDSVAVLSSGLVGAGMVIFFTGFSARAAFAAPAVFLPALMLYANLGSITDVPLASFVLLGLAPSTLLLALPELTDRLESWSPRAKLIAWILLLVIPLTAAVMMAAINEQIEAESVSEAEVAV